MNNKIFSILFAFIILVGACNMPHLREPKFSSKMQPITNNYKKILKAELLQIEPAWQRFNNKETHWVIVNILNPKKLPETSEGLDSISIQIAKDVYLQLVNKKDYTKIEIKFESNKGIFQLHNSIFYSFKELEK